MLIIPAIDLIGGRAVRLKEGRFETADDYGDPVAHARDFARAGAEWLHIVDLDGARAGAPAQTALISRIAAECGLKVQCGGGVREARDIEALLRAGAARAVVGSTAARRPGEVRDWIAEFGPDRVTCAFDAQPVGASFEVAVAGWREASGLTLDAALGAFPPGALKHVLVTDISRDGLLSGPNAALMRRLVAARPDLNIQASGGIAAIDDLDALEATGVAGAIVGRALYERRFTLEAALDR